MAVESAADRAGFVNVEEFGETVTYLPAAGASSDIPMIIDDPATLVDLGDIGAVSGRRTGLVPIEILPAAKRGDRFRRDAAHGNEMLELSGAARPDDSGDFLRLPFQVVK